MRDWNGLDVPDLGAVLGDGSVAAELSGLGDALNGHRGPLLLVSVGVVGLCLGIKVRVKIEAGDVVVSAVAKRVNDVVHDLDVAEEAALDSLEYSAESRSDVASLTFIKLLTDSVNTFDTLTENKHILLSNLFCDFNVGTVHGSDNKRSIHDEFHI